MEETESSDAAQPAGTILVPVANEETATRQLDTAADIATEYGYGITILHVVAVPPQVPLSEGESLLDDEDRELLDIAKGCLGDRDVPITTRRRYARSVAKGVVGSAVADDVQLILMGWRGRPPRSGVTLGGHIDTILRNAPTDVLVKRIKTPQPTDVEGVLVPVGEGPHTQLATHLGGAIARRHETTITLVTVVSPDATADETAAAESLLADAANRLEDVSIEQQIIEHEDVASALTDETATHDVSILGATERGLLRRRLLGSISGDVGRHAAGTVMIAQRHPNSDDEW